MVDELLGRFNEIVATAEKDGKNLSLFAIAKLDDASDGWSIIVSKPGIDNTESKRELFKYVVDMLVEKLTPQELADIARVGIFPLEEHLVEDILKYKKGHLAESFPANGNTVHEAYILESR